MKMIYIICNIIILVNLVLSSLHNSNICSENINFKCEADNTCCKTSNGYICHPIINGSCCPDGKDACDNGYYCDGSKGNRCVKKNNVK